MTDRVKKDHPGLPAFLGKAVLLAILLLAILFALGEAYRRFVPWQRFESPRTRMMWAEGYDGSDVVLIGDSAFCSFYVDSPRDTLWERIETLSGGKHKVFPGAMDACTPPDFVSAARWVARNWPEGTVAVIDIVPTRFAPTRTPKAAQGNYQEQFYAKRGIAQGEYSLAARARSVLKRGYYRLFFFRNPESLKNTVNGGPIDLNPNHRNIAWNSGLGDSRRTYPRLERDFLPDAPPLPVDWVAGVDDALTRAGIRPLYVLMPQNTALIARYASSPEKARIIATRLRAINESTREIFRRRGYEFLDLSDACRPEDFYDLIHTNASGDRRIAEAIVEWLENGGGGSGNSPL